MPFQVLVAPFVLWLLVVVYFTFKVDMEYAIAGLPPLIALVVLLVFRKEINYRFYRKNTPELDEPVRRLLERNFVFYRNLLPRQKAAFRRRVVLYVLRKNMKGMGLDELPNDLRAGVAIRAVMLSMAEEAYLQDGFDHIFLYPHPFPTPRFNQLHTVEVHQEDGAVILSAPHLMHATLKPRQYYDVGLHAFAEAYRLRFPQKPYPDTPEEYWRELQLISRFLRADVLKVAGLPDDEMFRWCMSVVLYFHFPERFRQLWSPRFEAITEVLDYQPFQVRLS